MVGYFQNKIWTGWNKGAFTQANNFNQTIKYHQKHLRLPPSQVHTKEVKYIQRNVTTLQQHIKWLMSRIPTFIEWLWWGQPAFFDKVEIMYQAI
jgi:hypothetical protein